MFHAITNLINPWEETLLELISITAQHVASCCFLFQHTSSDSYSLVTKSDCFNAA
jgi:hypothetical protein